MSRAAQDDVWENALVEKLLTLTNRHERDLRKSLHCLVCSPFITFSNVMCVGGLFSLMSFNQRRKAQVDTEMGDGRRFNIRLS